MRYRTIFASAFAAVFLTTVPSSAEPSATVRLLNRGPAPGSTFAYDPALIRIPAGGSVRFEPTDRGHNAVPVPSLWPTGGPALNVPFNQEATVTFDRSGVYAVQCTPHAGLGMVALIVVGDADLGAFASRLAAAPGLAPRARRGLSELAGAAR